VFYQRGLPEPEGAERMISLGWRIAYSIFASCSLIFSSSSFICTTTLWMFASLAFDPIGVYLTVLFPG